MDNLKDSAEPIDVASLHPSELLGLQCLYPGTYGQPSECCGNPDICRAACGDKRDLP